MTPERRNFVSNNILDAQIEVENAQAVIRALIIATNGESDTLYPKDTAGALRAVDGILSMVYDELEDANRALNIEEQKAADE